MIFYGAPRFQADKDVLAARLGKRISALSQPVWQGEWRLDALRTVLIEAGQLEQAVADALSVVPDSANARQVTHALQALTDAASLVFCRCLRRCREDLPGVEAQADAAEWEERRAEVVALTDACEQARKQIAHSPENCVMVNIPEGFAFYTLYPEAYAAAGQQWARDHAGENGLTVLVVGLRSIGTTLSAVVAATLQLAGWTVRRLTLRPTGHPFDRRATLDAASVSGVDCALVVDEGPGLSGSSMAGVAAALASAGLSQNAICFLPGHAGEPGGEASATTREWWRRAPRYVTPLQELRWNQRDLAAMLAERTSAFIGGGERVSRMEDVGSGAWRDALYGTSDAWPAACFAFERAKYLCRLESGAAILWKFAGLALTRDAGTQAEADFARLSRLAEGGWTPAPLDFAFGFVATSWLAGTPLAVEDADANTLAHIGRYLAAAAGPPLSLEEQQEALARLGEMLYGNVREAQGEETAAQTRLHLAAALRIVGEGALASYGDGRLAPCEWLRTSEGRLWKVDCAGNELDHSLIGRQSVGWDVAGALVEWELNMGAAQPLLAAFTASGGIRLPDELLLFYRLAYAAFRMGQMTLCAAMAAHVYDEQARCRASAERFQRHLLRLLAEASPEPNA